MPRVDVLVYELKKYKCPLHSFLPDGIDCGQEHIQKLKSKSPNEAPNRRPY